jgi:nucleoid DNA-binding protein
VETTKQYLNNELAKAQDLLHVNPESNAAKEIITRLINDLQSELRKGQI